MNKLRFRQLLESTLGNVKPLIVEEEELGTTILSPTPTPILRTPVPTPTPILKTPIPTPDAYVHNECYNLLQRMVIRNLDNILTYKYDILKTIDKLKDLKIFFYLTDLPSEFTEYFAP